MEFRRFVESQDLIDEPEALGNRLKDDGYLFFRSMIDHATQTELLREILGICQKHGWLYEGSDLMTRKGKADAYDGYFEFTNVYKEIQKLESFHNLSHHPSLLNVLSKALGGDVFPHPRNIGRITLPGSQKMTTPCHQDYVFIQGSQDFYTVWFPLHECPTELGGLVIASGSHKTGVLPTQEAEGTGGLCAVVDEEAQDWRTGDFKAGDFIIFHSLTVHRALHNTSKELLRVSCDYRYQLQSDQVVVWDTLRPHMQLHSWEDIYAGWKNDRHKFYWHQLDLEVKPTVNPWEVQPTIHQD